MVAQANILVETWFILPKIGNDTKNPVSARCDFDDKAAFFTVSAGGNEVLLPNNPVDCHPCVPDSQSFCRALLLARPKYTNLVEQSIDFRF
ncbi:MULTISPECIES: hypothetical protein [unclassified Microcoleus]|uniref:hypothetical protein n=1 Tax=unclassified Microcoleus TaxID=2642155 RepID=UPI002FCF9F76